MTVDGSYFDAMYSSCDDPWGFRTRWYEQRKRALSMAALPRERYGRAFEPGCAIGLLTGELASRCDRVLAWEGSAEAASQAREESAAAGNVLVRRARVPAEWPEGPFDLVVLSELLYYFDDADLASVLDRTRESLGPGGTVLAVHWRHTVPEHVRSGDDAHLALAAVPGLVRMVEHVEEDFLLELYQAGDGGEPVSVARAGGLV
ncbi:class I SAM-dependent methyltransferase [Nocardiopsis sp. CT-R113]|uniref:Class I SAM-dependent methyltransferase n=1 Tax=Nocardiopsis codii TaxID=3065942 RepID=A0ABU7K0V1_9ACTN|nr:class I SAM-dependent methyltransferase [Nocardiopsis sp. CT-R113]MEE2035799.1 class I SAM-dependent methyltransferase [Nocardiopsis sp. CT-R113]